MSESAASRRIEDIADVAVSELRPHPDNPRKISRERLAQLKRSLEADPDLLRARPLIALRDGTVIAGNQRLRAAVELGWPSVPVVYADVDEQTARLWMLRDNNSFGDWDERPLAEMLAGLAEGGVELALAGFEGSTVDGLLSGLAAERDRPDPDDTPPMPDGEPRSKTGEVYELGPHRLLCGDSTDLDAMRAFLPDEPLFVYADPPYGMNVVKVRGGAKGATGNVGGNNPFGGRKGKVHGNARKAIIAVNEYLPVIGDDSTDTAIRSYEVAAALGARVMVFWGGNFYAEALPPTRGWIVWDKELDAPAFSEAELAWTNLDQPIRMFRHKWAGLMKASERGQKRVHPTQKPAALAQWCLERFAKPDDVVFDPFCGSGSGLIGADMARKRCFAVEMSPAYCDVIRDRWEAWNAATD